MLAPKFYDTFYSYANYTYIIDFNNKINQVVEIINKHHKEKNQTSELLKIATAP